MSRLPDAPLLVRALRTVPSLADIAATELVSLPQKGLAHAHWRIGARGLVLRVPRRADGAASLAVQAAGFERGAASGRTPRLHAVLPPSPELPQGGLVIDEIVGRVPRLPGELTLLAEALAALHALPLPPPDERSPLADPADPFAATLATIERNLAFAPRAALAPAALAQIEAERAWAHAFAADIGRMEPGPHSLVVNDAHPGNFLITPSGLAVFVDLERVAYGSPAVDIAHATLAPATRWDPDCGTVLARDDVLRFVHAYCTAAGPAVAAALQPWLLPFRRLVWLRTTAAFVRFRAEGTAADLDPAAAAHAARVIAISLSPAAIAESRREWLGPDPLTF